MSWRGFSSVFGRVFLVGCCSALYLGRVHALTEREILGEIFSDTDGGLWTTTTNWNTDADICTWYGVECASGSTAQDVQRISAIKLGANGLKGKLPETVYSLAKMETLDVKDNEELVVSFVGIEEAISLKTLYLSDTSTNSLVGIGGAAGLTELHLTNTSIQGTLDDEFYSLTSLESVFLSFNFLSGQLSTKIGQLTSLKEFYCYHNEFTGALPSEFGLLTNMEYITIGGNDWAGTLPSEFESMTNLKSLSIRNERDGIADRYSFGLTGSLLPFANHPNMKEYHLNYNRFSGPIPSNLLEAAKSLSSVSVNLTKNEITGPIPDELAEFSSLSIDLTGNKIEGENAIPATMCSKASWMDGDVGKYNCDGIMCPPGTFSQWGRQVSDTEPCAPCVISMEYGSRSCDVPSEREILTMLYNSTHGGNWSTRQVWMDPAVPICQWSGITCEGGSNSDSGVTKIDLSYNKLTGQVPTEIYLLPKLQVLNLMDNQIDISFKGLHFLSNLTSLLLSGNNITSLEFIGQAPPTLQTLFLGQNQLSGASLPWGLFNLVNLRELGLEFASLGGTIPPKIGDLKNLVKLTLNDNNLSGPIPSEIGNLSKLRELTLSKNSLTGNLPSTMNSMTSLEVLSIRKQRGNAGATGITGPLLDFAKLPNLSELYLDDNSLEGEIPLTFMEASTLVHDTVYVDLSKNKLSGILPGELSRFDFLVINLQDNMMTGIAPELCSKTNWMTGDVDLYGCDGILCPVGSYSTAKGRQAGTSAPCELCPEAMYLGSSNCSKPLSAMSERDILEDVYNKMGGTMWTNKQNWTVEGVPICSWHGITCMTASGLPDRSKDSGVTKIELQNNGLIGIAPVTLFYLSELQDLNLMRNDIEFSFDHIGYLKNLTYLFLSETGLESIHGVGSAKTLQVFYAAGNYIEEQLPNDIFNLGNIRTLDLSRNLFSGTLSEDIGALTTLKTLDLNDNSFSGPVPSSIGKLVALKELTMSKNAFSGPLPASLSNLNQLEILSFRKQREKHDVGISGPLPDFAGLTMLFELYLDGNSLEGPIPSTFLSGSTVADGLIYASLSRNKLNGTVPAELEMFKQLILSLDDNMISGISENLCSMTEWMDGDVGEFGCNAILCPPGTYNAMHGRQTTDQAVCEECPATDTSFFYGRTQCVEKESAIERDILMEFYNACGGKDWWNNENWGSEEVGICDWYGIDCQEDGLVGDIRLGANNVVGTPPSSLFTIPNLEVLWLYSNPIEFSFDGIAEATKLTSLLLDSTGLDSVSGLGEAASLVSLDLRFNRLAGDFPYDEIKKLTKLKTLYISDNLLSGELRTSRIETLTLLEDFKVGSNGFSGRLPRFYGFKHLTTVDLSNNEFSGEIDPTFLKTVEVDDIDHVLVDLSSNQLSGVVPNDAFGKFAHLSIFLRDNQFTGVDAQLCGKTAWNDGDVGQYGCDGILCPVGTSNELGRQRDEDTPCLPCDKSTFMGDVNCGEDREASFGISSSASYQAGSGGLPMFPIVVLSWTLWAMWP